MLIKLSKSFFLVLFVCVISAFGNLSAERKSIKGELISHVQIKKHPSNSHLTVVKFALHYDARVTVFMRKRGSSALIQFKKTAELRKGVKTLQVDQVRYPSSQYEMVIKAGKVSKVVDFSL